MRKEHKEKRMKLVIVLEEYLYILGIHYISVGILEGITIENRIY